ncbi:MAG: hypothetical protein IJA86_04410 [Clostridia bacterium]|nr:hypothetical protein [Clostridia bacterium]
MKKGRFLWGIVIIAIGIIFALRAFNINIPVFFDGWWTLFIIVPCAIGLFTEREKLGNAIGVGIGVLLLLACRDILSFGMIWKLAVPVILILIGLKMIFGNLFNKKETAVYEKIKTDGQELKSGTAIFTGSKINFDGEPFHGAELNSIFGGLDFDLRGASVTEDCVIHACAIFGGIDIIIPENLNVKINSNSIFGGVSEKRKFPFREDLPTVYINATCIFGGMDIK